MHNTIISFLSIVSVIIAIIVYHIIVLPDYFSASWYFVFSVLLSVVGWIVARWFARDTNEWKKNTVLTSVSVFFTVWCFYWMSIVLLLDRSLFWWDGLGSLIAGIFFFLFFAILFGSSPKKFSLFATLSFVCFLIVWLPYKSYSRYSSHYSSDDSPCFHTRPALICYTQEKWLSFLPVGSTQLDYSFQLWWLNRHWMYHDIYRTDLTVIFSWSVYDNEVFFGWRLIVDRSPWKQWLYFLSGDQFEPSLIVSWFVSLVPPSIKNLQYTRQYHTQNTLLFEQKTKTLYRYTREEWLQSKKVWDSVQYIWYQWSPYLLIDSKIWYDHPWWASFSLVPLSWMDADQFDFIMPQKYHIFLDEPWYATDWSGLRLYDTYIGEFDPSFVSLWRVWSQPNIWYDDKYRYVWSQRFDREWLSNEELFTRYNGIQD